VPVKAFTATDSGGEVHLNQFHAECKSRILCKTICSIHDEVIKIVSVPGETEPL
jgi:non-homologous end joining protein Ku